jgi:hypothetical protein
MADILLFKIESVKIFIRLEIFYSCVGMYLFKLWWVGLSIKVASKWALMRPFVICGQC